MEEDGRLMVSWAERKEKTSWAAFVHLTLESCVAVVSGMVVTGFITK